MSKLDQTRQKALEELNAVSEKQRFGYFSIPATLAIGDSQFGSKSVRKDELGRVATQPRNIATKPTASGNVKSSYFSLDKSIYEGDPYMDPGKLDRLEHLKQSKMQPQGKEVYKPATSVSKSLMSSSYPHIPVDNTQRNLKAHRNAEGTVIVHPPNINTSPSSKIANTLFKAPKYENSPFDAEHQLKLKQIQEHKSKLPQSMFKPLGPGGRDFSSSKAVFGCDVEMPQKKSTESKLNIASHDTNFRPSNPPKKGVLGTIGKFPEYKENPPQQTKRQEPIENAKEPFRLRSPEKLTAPCPSVTLNAVNLRRCLR